MFKIESYLGPLLLGYIDKYVKLRPEDLQLSLWGGDVVLSKLDLRLEAIEKASSLPITLTSGHIHDLRLHVPWTKLGSEPVRITFNTIECVVKLRESACDDGSSAASTGSNKQLQQPSIKGKHQGATDLPPGYLQSWVNSIVNNLNIVVNNLILKFVEDDIVLSVNVKSAECYSVDGDWSRAFVELAVPDLVLRREIDFQDITVCLDKRNASGKIETYQDPLFYRCSMTCRLHMTYDSPNSKFPSLTKFNVFCERLELSLTDIQLPMFARLMELCLAIYYGELDTTQADSVSHDLPPMEITRSQVSSESGLETGESELIEDGAQLQQKEGWASWAWSYVPSILPDSEDEQGGTTKYSSHPSVLAVGLYCSQSTVIFKLTETVRESSYYGPQKVTFVPFLQWDAEGVGLEVILKGLEYFNVQFGIASTHLKCLGDAICGVNDLEQTGRDPIFLRFLQPEREVKLMNYLTNSLFDPGGPDNQGVKWEYAWSHDGHLEKFTEESMTKRWGALSMDYVYTMDQHKPPSHGSHTSISSIDENDVVKELSNIRCLLCHLSVTISSSMVQRVDKFIYCLKDHEYEPYSKPRKEFIDERREPPSEDDVRKLEAFVATRCYQITFLHPSITLLANDLPAYDVKKKRVNSDLKKKKMKQKSYSSAEITALPIVIFKTDRLEVQKTLPMWPRHIVRTVSSMATPSSDLLHHCHTQIYYKVYSLVVEMTTLEPGTDPPATQCLLQPTSAVWYSKILLLKSYWKNPLQPISDTHFELPHLTLNVTKPQCLLLAHLALTWQDKKPEPAKLHNLSLLTDIFKCSAGTRGQNLVLSTSLSGLQLEWCETEAVMAATGGAESFCVILMSSADAKMATMVPLLYIPQNTADLHSCQSFSVENPNSLPDLPSIDCITFTVQIPKDAEIPQAPGAIFLDIQGISGTLDPWFYEWLTYTPISKVSNLSSVTPSGGEAKLKVIDTSMADATSPLKDRGTSQGSQTGSHPTLPTDTPSHQRTTSQTFSRSQKLTSTVEKAEVKESVTTSKRWGEKLAHLYPLVKMMEIQIEVGCWVAFLPTRPIRIPDPSKNIAQNMRQALNASILPATLVVCCPKVSLQSAGHKGNSSPPTDIPILALEHSVAGNKLPWSVQLSHYSVYSLGTHPKPQHVVKPSSIKATLAVSTKYNPPASDNITSLGLCVHADMQTVGLACSSPQVQLAYVLCCEVVNTSSKIIQSFKTLQHLHKAVPVEEPVQSSRNGTATPPLPTFFAGSVPPQSTSSQMGATDAGLITETSDSLSRDLSPSTDTTASEASGVKLSAWLQWTLLKLVGKVYTQDCSENDVCLTTAVEDVTASIDLQEVYSKIKCKVGSVNIHHFKKSMGTTCWQPPGPSTVIVSSADYLPRSLQIVTPKLWSNHPTSSNLFNQEEFKAKDKTHGFISLTMTRALRKNARKRLQEAGIDCGSSGSGGKGIERGSVYLNEVILNMQPCDIVLNCPAIANILKVAVIKHISMPPGEVRRANISQTSQMPVKTVKTALSNRMPYITSGNLPLLYVNATNLRLFAPSYCRSDTKAAGVHYNLCLLQVASVCLVPQADNPLPRVITNKDVFRRAVHAGIIHQAGSEVEDRQYQLDVCGLSLSTGHWEELIEHGTAQVEQPQPNTQNPALEWNMQKAGSDIEDIHLLPLALNCDLRAIGAPAVTYQPQNDPLDKGPVLVCGYSLEMNATSDMDFYLSVSQLQLINEIIINNIGSLKTITNLEKKPHQKDKSKQATDAAHREETSVHDSGVESEASTVMSKLVLEQDPATSDGSTTARDKQQYQTSEFTPFNILLTAGKVSLMVYDHVRKLSEVAEADIVTSESPTSPQLHIIPIMFAYFSQPHTIVSCEADSQKIELSCYDIVLKGPTKGHTVTGAIRLLPDTTDFGQHWVETRPGPPHPKTGIPPSLYTLNITNFITQPATVEMRLARPVRVNCSIQLLQQLEDLARRLQEVECLEKQQESNIPQQPKILTDSSDRQMSSLQHLACLSQLKFHSTQLVFAMEISSEVDGPAIQLSLSEIDGKMKFDTEGSQWVHEVGSHLVIDRLLVKSRYKQRWRPLIGPVTGSVAADVEWCAHSGPATWPQILLAVQVGPIISYWGQGHHLCIKALADGFLKYQEDNRKISNQTKMKKSNTKSANCDEPLRSSPARGDKSVQQPLIVQEHLDDLRDSDFEYITEPDSPEDLPGPKEIVFHSDFERGRANMTWCYSEPRVLMSLKVTPVPFSLPQVMDVKYIDETLKVPCLLQHWNPLIQQFDDYAEFGLSENEEVVAVLPEVTASYKSEVVVAQTWRLLILHPRDRDPDCRALYSLSSMDGLDPVVSPLALAASARVDSCFVPSLIPMVQCSMNTSSIELHLAHHLEYLEVPSTLMPFKPDKAEPLEQEFLVMSMMTPSMTASYIHANTQRAEIQSNCSLRCEVMDYHSLTMHPLVTVTDINLQATWSKQLKKQTIKAAVYSETVDFSMRSSSVHTLSSLPWLFAKPGNELAVRPMLYYYMICNDTQHTLKLGQVDTEECIMLPSRRVHAYAWRTHIVPRKLQFGLEGLRLTWSDGVSLDCPGIYVREVHRGERQATIIIRITRLTNVQTMVTVMGELILSSQLAQKLELRVCGSGQDVQPSSMLTQSQALASYVVETGQQMTLRVRLPDQCSPWSHEIAVSGEKSKDHRLIKVAGGDRSSSAHLWCQVTQSMGPEQHTLVLFSPLFVVRSQLPMPFLMNLETPRLKTSQQLQLEGKGSEHQLLIGGDLTHNVTFQLGTKMKPSNPLISLSSGMIEQLPYQPLDSSTFADMMKHERKSNGINMWPYNQASASSCLESVEEAPSVGSHNQVVHMHPPEISSAPSSTSQMMDIQPDIDLQVTLSQHCPGSRSLLITIAPHWLLVNECGCDLYLVDSTEKKWQLRDQCTLVPPDLKMEGSHLDSSYEMLQGCFRLGLSHHGTLHTSSPIVLSDEDDRSRYLPKVCCLLLHSTVKQDMRILTVRPAFSAINHTHHHLDMACCIIPLGHQKVSVEPFNLPMQTLDHTCTTSRTTSPILLWTLPYIIEKDQICISESEELVLYIFFRQRSSKILDTQMVSPPCLLSESSWSTPVRIKIRAGGSRQGLAVPRCESQGDHFCTESCSVTCSQHDGATFLAVTLDPHPPIALHNHCQFPLHFGQTLINKNYPDLTVYEEAELLLALPTLSPGGHMHYAPASVNASFPEFPAENAQYKLHLSACSHATEESKVSGWSTGIDLKSEHDVFVHVPQLSDIKAHIEKVGHTTHVFLDKMSRAEVSAREIRSRIQGQDKVKVDVIEAKWEYVERDGTVFDDSSTKISGAPHVSISAPVEGSMGPTVKLVPPHQLSIEFDMLIQQLKFVLLEEKVELDVANELMRVTADRIFLSFHPKTDVDTLSNLWPRTFNMFTLCVGDVQMDNQSYQKGAYDFPVVMIKQDGLEAVQFDDVFMKLATATKVEQLCRSSMVSVSVLLCKDEMTGDYNTQTILVNLKPIKLYIEDKYIYHLLEQIDHIIPSVLNHGTTTKPRPHRLPVEVCSINNILSHPLRLNSLTIEPIYLLLSVHASMKLFVAVDNTPLSFGQFGRTAVFTTSQHLVKNLAMHYATGALFRAGWVVGSLEILGSPTGLIRNVGTGVADLFRLPYEGLGQGPGGFLIGVRQGTASLLRNVSSGMLTSVTNFASSISRNMERLSMDVDHQERQESSRRHKPAGLTDGLHNGLTGFGLSLLGAVAGLADQPLRGLSQPVGNVPPSPTQAATGIVSGVGKGIVGAFTKPIGGAAELVSQTGLGLLQGTGLSSSPLPRYKPTESLVASYSSLKFIQKMLQTVPQGEVLLHMPALQPQQLPTAPPVPLLLLLTPEVLFIISQAEDCQQRAFAVGEVECQRGTPGDGRLVLVPQTKSTKLQKTSWANHESSSDRIAAFISSTTSLQTSSSSSQELMTHSPGGSQIHLDVPATGSMYEFLLEPRLLELFLSVFILAKNKVTATGFSV